MKLGRSQTPRGTCGSTVALPKLISGRAPLRSSTTAPAGSALRRAGYVVADVVHSQYAHLLLVLDGSAGG